MTYNHTPILFSRSIWQAFSEAFFIGAVLWVGSFKLQMMIHPTQSSYLFFEWMLGYTINPLSLLWFVLRAQPTQKQGRKKTLEYIISAFLLTLVLDLLFLSLYYLFGGGEESGPFFSSLIIIFWVHGGWIFCASWMARLFRYWYQRKQQSLAWGLTYAHIMILISLLAIVIIVVEGWGVLTQESWGLLNMIPTLFFMSGLMMLLVLIFVPPLAFFSQLATRRTVKRLTDLVVATTELSAGRYTNRIPVVGQDEVAQLQINFNAMADELQQKIQDLQQERDRVASLLKERRELFANVSHELRTPIATFLGYLETNLNNASHISPPSVLQDLKVMQREVLQLQQRTEDLFTLSRAEVKQLPVQVKPCDIHPLLQTVVESEASLAWRSSLVEITLNAPDHLPPVNADPQRLEQALKNILRNALKHTSPGDVIIVAAEITAEQVSVSIEDTGEGIAPDKIEHIWERFYQAPSSRTRGGTGLGLALVKEWIEAMGGHVAVTSVVGEGSTFTLSLARVQDGDEQ